MKKPYRALMKLNRGSDVKTLHFEAFWDKV